VAELNDVQVSGVQLLWQKLEKREFLDCIELANKLCETARTKQGVDSIKVQTACLVAGGDANFGLKRFERALDLYEQARQLTEEHFGLLSEESMHALFRMERGLNAIAVIEGSADPQDVLTMTLLLNSQIGTGTPSEMESELGDEELKELWQERLEKKVKAKSTSTNPFRLYVDALATRLASSSTEQFLMRIAIAACIVGGLSLAFYAFQWFQTHRQSTEYLVNQDYSHTASLAKLRQLQKEKAIEFALPNSQKTVLLTSLGDAQLVDRSTGRSRTLPVVIYDGSFLSHLSVLSMSWVRENLWVKWNGFALQAPNGMCYYDTAEPEYLTVKKMYALGGWAQEYFKKHSCYPSEEAALEELRYSNPMTQHGERASLVDAKLDVGTIQAFCSAASIATHPGMIVCFRAGPTKERFLIAAFDRSGRAIATPGSTDGFLALRPSTSLPRPRSLDDANHVEGLVVLERPIGEFWIFLCQHGWVVAIGCIAIMLLLALMFAGASKLSSTKTALKTARRRGKKKSAASQ
jgi:hypothetical protein